MKRAISTEKVIEYIERAFKARGTDEYHKQLLLTEHKSKGKWIFSGWYEPFIFSNSSFYIKSFKGSFYLYDEPTNTRYLLRKDNNCFDFFGIRKEDI